MFIETIRIRKRWNVYLMIILLKYRSISRHSIIFILIFLHKYFSIPGKFGQNTKSNNKDRRQRHQFILIFNLWYKNYCYIGQTKRNSIHTSIQLIDKRLQINDNSLIKCHDNHRCTSSLQNQIFINF